MEHHHLTLDDDERDRSLEDHDVDLVRSNGILVRVGDRWRLDATGLERTRLGWNSSPLLGAAHFQAAWSNNPRDLELQRLVQAARALRQRVEGRESGKWIASVGDRIAQFQESGSLVKDASPVDAVRAYVAMSMLDQFPDSIASFELTARKHLRRWSESPGSGVRAGVVDGMDIHLDFATPRAAREKWLIRGAYGIESQAPEGSRLTLSGSLAVRGEVGQLFWGQLDKWLSAASIQPAESIDLTSLVPGDPTRRYELVRRILELRSNRAGSRQPSADPEDPIQVIRTQLQHERHANVQAHWLNRDNYPRFRQQILDLQQTVYEPARQSPPEEFDAIFESPRPVAIVLTDADRIVGMGLAGPLPAYRDVRGTMTDPFADDPNVLYMVDVTVLPQYRGGFGRLIKSAVVIRALQQGYSAIHGRNRDRVARGMWAINLSLGSFELQYLVDDYPDQLPHRDCLYYRCPLRWDPGDDMPNQPTDLQIARLIHGHLG